VTSNEVGVATEGFVQQKQDSLLLALTVGIHRRLDLAGATLRQRCLIVTTVAVWTIGNTSAVWQARARQSEE
jgi:hypothetical protein